MAKRHVLNPEDWQSVFLRLEELIVANSGGDAYEETFKILLAKLWEEKRNPETRVFVSKPEVTGLRSRIERMLQLANKDWSGIVDDGVALSLTDEHLAVSVHVVGVERVGLRVVGRDGPCQVGARQRAWPKPGPARRELQAVREL